MEETGLVRHRLLLSLMIVLYAAFELGVFHLPSASELAQFNLADGVPSGNDPVSDGSPLFPHSPSMGNPAKFGVFVAGWLIFTGRSPLV